MDIKGVIATVKEPESGGRRSKGSLAIRYVEIPVAHWPKFQKVYEGMGGTGQLTAPLMRQIVYGVFDLGKDLEEGEKIVSDSKKR